jgi:signal transduction histidine kinase
MRSVKALHSAGENRDGPFDIAVGTAAFVVTVVVGLITVLAAMEDAAPAQVIALCLVTLLYCIIGTVVYARVETSSSMPARVLYFATQLAIGTIIAYLGNVISRGQGALWLVFMPLVSHAVTSLRWRGALLIAALVVVAFFSAVWLLNGRVNPILVLQYAVSVLFVSVFTYIAKREQRSRVQIEQLASDLREANRKLSEYSMQVEELATTRERNRLAREVHDSLGHYLTTVNVQIEAARATLAADPAKASKALNKAQLITREGLSEVRRSVAALRAGPMDNRNLIDAIDALVDETRESGLDVNLAVAGTLRGLPSQAEMTLYRAAQEGLTNVRKHAKATQAGVLLAFEANSVRLSIRDDGEAGEAGDAPAGEGFGLMGLRERAQMLGGEVRTRREGGFVLEVEIPA